MKSAPRILSIALLLAGLFFVNYLASSLPVRVDATAEKIYTLSPGTRELLRKLEEPVQLELYFSRSSTTLPIGLKNYADRVREMLGQYARAAHGKLQLTVIDPKPDTPDEERATAAGISPQTWPGSGESFYFGLVAIQAEQQKVLPALSTDREQFLEYDLSQLIYQVQLFSKPKLGLLTSLPLRGQMDYMAMQSGRMPENQLVVTEWEKSYEIVTIDANADILPAGLDVLAVIHPQNLPRRLQFAIDQFLLSGKPVFLAIDPSSRYFRSRGNQMAMYGAPPANVSSDLPELFKGWGIVYSPDKIVGDPDNATQVQVSAGSVVRYPIWLNLARSSISATSLPTSQLESMLLIEPGSFSLSDGTGLSLIPLLQSSALSGEIPGMLASMSQPEDLARQIKPTGRKVLAALVRGKFKTAFPDGAPKDEKPADPESKQADKPAPAKAPAAYAKAVPALRESAAKSTLLVIADTDWLFDDYSVRKMNFLGTTAYEPLNDNLSFAGNALDFLSGSQDLISIRGKGTSLRPFTVVHDIEVRAQQKYQEQLTSLESRLTQVQNQLTGLEGRKTESGRLGATPEVTKSIESLRRQQVQFRAERRAIRKSLREDIEALENRLLIINLLSVPLLIGACGAWFYIRRHK